MQDIFAEIVAWFSQTFAVAASPPWAAPLIMTVSVLVSSLSNLAMRRFADMRRLKRIQAEVKQYQELQKQAQKTQNEKLLRKVKRRKAYIDRIQREMMTTRCKPSLIFLVPFMLMFSILRAFYAPDGVDVVVAILPFNADKILPFLVGMIGVSTPAGFGMTFIGFYFLAGLGLSSILQRIMGTQIT